MCICVCVCSTGGCFHSSSKKTKQDYVLTMDFCYFFPNTIHIVSSVSVVCCYVTTTAKFGGLKE